MGYLFLLPQYPKVAWKTVVLNTTLHPRFKFILWLAVQNRLTTVDRLLKIGIVVPTDCAFCATTRETFDHLFFGCCVTRSVWNRLLAWLGCARTVGSWPDELTWACQIAKRKNGKSSIAAYCFAMTVYIIWRERNNLRFKQGYFDAAKIYWEIALHIHIRGNGIQLWQNALLSLNSIP
ncbi:uncharacterized protein LOC132047761 [Lycium ferocissimum]|uniref:uncharacterized protein LOC132047761 n=1 Tax=Lycium ferocissimum TaxID=112874 RepID=UPI0028162657|nr:uncharacterized protein LOC132047761 [Lycium ferocissimum]